MRAEMSVAVPGGVGRLVTRMVADTLMKETIPHGVLWALLRPFAGRLRHRWLTVRVYIGEIPVPMTERKGNDWFG
jgi:hypothetical protein